MKIRTKLSIVILPLVLLPMLFIGMFGYFHAKKSLAQGVFKDLKLFSETKEAEILDYLESKRQKAADFASGGFISNKVEQIISLKNIEERKKAGRILSSHLRTNKKPLDPDILDIQILDLEGRIIADTDEESLGSDKDKDQPYFLNGKRETYIQQPYIHESHGVKQRCIAVATQVKNINNNKVMGVLMNCYVLENLKDVLSGVRSRKLEYRMQMENIKPAEILLCDNSGQMIASSSEKAVEYIGRKIETEPVLKCLDNSEEIKGEWTDYRGVKIWGASSCIRTEKDRHWVLVVKKDKEEAIAGILRLRDLSLGIGAISLLVASLAALLTARLISKPIHALQVGTEIVGGGNLDYKVGTDAGDEIGQLSRSFDEMTENLKTAAIKLIESEERYRRLFETSKDGILLLDYDTGHILAVNPAIVHMMGYTEGEFIGKSFKDIGLLKDRADFGEIVPVLKETGFVHYQDVLVETKKGKSIDTEIYLVNRANIIQCNVRDITERKQHEEILKKNEAFIKNILETVSEGFIVIDPELRIISANRAYCNQVGLALEDIIGKHCYEVSHRLDKPCSQEGEKCDVEHTFKTGMPYSAIHTHYDGGGNPVYIETKSYPVKDASGKVTTVIETLNDVTAKRKLEEQLSQSQKMEAVGELAGGIAHDFNNMLTAIIGYANLLSMKIETNSPLKFFVDPIISSAEKAANVTRQLLAFSRKQIISPQETNLNELIIDIEKLLCRIIGEDIEFKTMLVCKDLFVMADPGQIEQVLMNLCTNAKDAMLNGGLLSISTEVVQLDEEYRMTHDLEKPGMYACIAVTDSGIGMDEKTRKRIFEPFFTTKELGKGTGLGLSIVYGIIKQHNGNIIVYSEPGKGTTFKIYLPLIELPVSEERTLEVIMPKEGTETILITEDNEEVRTLMRHVLEEFGYKVIEAEDGEEAVNKFKENKDRIDLVMLDVIMPKKNGKEAGDEIKKIKPDTRILFTSGYTADIVHQRGILEEGMDFISKPVTPHNLLIKIRGILDKKA